MNINEVPYDVPEMWQYYKLHFDLKGVEHPRVVIHGNGGKYNMGDDAILEVILYRILENLPNAHITVVCYGPEVVKKRYAHIKNLQATCFKSIGAIIAAFTCDLYIIGGGGILNKTNVYSGFNKWKFLDFKGKYMYFAIIMAKLSGALTNFYGIGATSFNDPVVKWLALKVIPKSDIVSMRDKMSIDNFKRAGVVKKIYQILDPAFSLVPATQDIGKQIIRKWGVDIDTHPRPLVGLCMRYIPEYVGSNEQTLRETVALIQYIDSELGMDVFYIPTSQHPDKQIEDDLHFGRELRRRLCQKNSNFYMMEQFYNPNEFKAVLGLLDGAILERLHGMILSCMQGVPLFAIAYDTKIHMFSKIATRDDIPIEPPYVLDHGDFTQGKIYEYIDPFVGQVRSRYAKRSK